MGYALMPAVEERRRDARFSGDALGGVRGTVRPGHLVTVVDLSRGGALVEAGRPLRPGATVHLQFERGARRLVLAAHVLRCAVWALNADEGVVYRGALRFESRCDLLSDANAWRRADDSAADAAGTEACTGRHPRPDPTRRVDSERQRTRR